MEEHNVVAMLRPLNTIMRCQKCNHFTTWGEAALRNFNEYRCAHCNGPLEEYECGRERAD